MKTIRLSNEHADYLLDLLRNERDALHASLKEMPVSERSTVYEEIEDIDRISSQIAGAIES